MAGRPGSDHRRAPLLFILALALAVTACDAGSTPAASSGPGASGEPGATSASTAAPTGTLATAPPATAPAATPPSETEGPTPSATATPVPSPSASPPPAASSVLTVTVRDTHAMETDWRKTKSVGRALFSFFLANPTDEPRYPACTMDVESTRPARSVSLPWASRTAVPANGQIAATALLGNVPMANGTTIDLFTYTISCTGWLTPRAGATAAMPKYVRTRVSSSSLVSTSGSTATLRITIKATNPATSSVRVRCWLMVAGAPIANAGYGSSVRVKAYRPTDRRTVRAKSTATLTFTVTRAPVQVGANGSRRWAYYAQCWVP